MARGEFSIAILPSCWRALVGKFQALGNAKECVSGPRDQASGAWDLFLKGGKKWQSINTSTSTILPRSLKLWGYRRDYNDHHLRRKGFATKADAEEDLKRVINDADALARGEVRVQPTTVQDALDIYRRNLEVRGKDKSSNYRHKLESNCNRLQEFVDRFGPKRLVREITETDLREYYQHLSTSLAKSSARFYLGRLCGMMKGAQDTRDDLVKWLRPKLSRLPKRMSTSAGPSSRKSTTN